ncbi:MAG: hypothetical protein WBG43_09255 [Marinifilaceae bacterium]
MTIINIDNYEEYMIDYLEDSLSPSLLLEMQNFLALNPDILEEIEGLDEVVLVEDNIKYSNKELLYKDVDSSIFEDKCINYIENQLTSTERTSFEQEVSLDLGKNYLLKDYKKTILVADDSIIYSNKDSLKRNFPFRFKKLLHFATAASIIFAISMSVLFIPNKYDETERISKNTEVFNMPKEDIPQDIIKNPEQAFKENIAEVKIEKSIKKNITVDVKPVVKKVVERRKIIAKITIKNLDQSSMTKEIDLSNTLAYNDIDIKEENNLSNKEIREMSNEMTLNESASEWQEESTETPKEKRQRNILKRSGDKIIGFLSQHFHTEKITYTKEIIINE